MRAEVVERLDWTNRMCRDDPYAAAIRKTLTGVERERHKLGWDGAAVNARLFQLDRNDDAPEIELSWCTGFQNVLDIVVNENDGRVGAGLAAMGEVIVKVSQALRTGTAVADAIDVDPDSAPLASIEMMAREFALRDVGEAGEDMSPGQSPGFTLFGYGICAVAWGVSIDPDDEEGKKLAWEHRLHEHPDRREERCVYFLGRDGLLWTTSRVRGEQFATTLAYLPDSAGHIGLIVKGLSLLVRAVVNNPVWIWPDKESRPPDGGERKHPLVRRQ